jgi:hypothetical protein
MLQRKIGHLDERFCVTAGDKANKPTMRGKQTS